MDNPEKMTTLGTQDTGWRQVKQNKTQRTKQMSNIDPHQQPGVNPGIHEGQAAPASY
jgi:hypothetical protein